jgi:heme exporter protein B
MRFWRQTLEIARVDLRIEGRLGDVIRLVIPFALIALLVFPLAMGLDLAAISLIGPAVFWSVGILFGMQVALRQAVAETPERRDLYALLGVDPAAKLIGRSMSGSILMLAFLATLFLAMIALYSPDLPAGWAWPMILAVILVGIGLTELGTLAGEITVGLRNRTALASLLVAPLAVPLIMGGSQTLEAVARNRSILPWSILLVTTDLALAVIGVAVAGSLEEASR